jgi:amino acid transporter
MTPEQIMVLVGIVTSIAISIAKLLKKYNESSPVWKIAPAALVPILIVGFSHHWGLDSTTFFEMLTGVLSALGTYGAISRPLRKSIVEEKLNTI